MVHKYSGPIARSAPQIIESAKSKKKSNYIISESDPVLLLPKIHKRAIKNIT